MALPCSTSRSGLDGSVTNMYRILTQARAFNQPIGDWDVSSVTNMGSVFSGAAAFNQPIGGWDVSSVTQMSFMFRHTKHAQPADRAGRVPVTSMVMAAFDRATGLNVSSVTIVAWMSLARRRSTSRSGAGTCPRDEHVHMFRAKLNQPIGLGRVR